MEIETYSDISEEHIKAAITFGVQSSDLSQIDAKTYSIAFLKQLLHHTEKANKNLLEAHLNPVIAKLWQEVLSSLEERNRKLTNIKSGSLVFTLFWLTDDSLQQLQDETWRIKLQAQVEKLLKALGMLESPLKIVKVVGSSLFANCLNKTNGQKLFFRKNYESNFLMERE